MKGRVLIIAGSDSSGGAGIQADIKTVTALGGYAATAITAVTVQSTLGVSAVHQVPPDILSGQIESVLNDIGADAIKLGMIGDIAAGEIIARALKSHSEIPIIIDPVLAATSGDELASKAIPSFIREHLLPLATLITPNLPEAEALTNLSEQAAAAHALVKAGAKAALVKGGHGISNTVTDTLCVGSVITEYKNPRLNTQHTHGTGCTLASAIATGVAQGLSLEVAAARAIAYVHEAIRSAPGYGKGHGPLNHAHMLD